MHSLRSLCLGAMIAASAPLVVTTAALAQDTAPAKPEKPAPTLKVGMPAPEFKVEKFIKGKEFSGFEKEKVYVVEFWATWCGPCIMGMPHLSELQREYKDKGVTIVGVNVWEEREYNDKTLEKVVKFVEGKGADMDYTVVYDGPTKVMDTAWMKAAGQNGIPAAFVVDQKGTVAWIGHPMNLDMVLDEVVAKKWDPATGEERMRAAEKAFEDAAKKFETGLADGNTAWDEAVKTYPVMGKKLHSQRFGAMLAAGHTKEAVELGNKLADEAIKAKKSGALMELMGAMADPASLKTPESKALLLKVATANFELSDKTQYGPHVTVARAYFIAGETEKGREASKKALELAPERIRPRIEAWLKEAETSAGAK